MGLPGSNRHSVSVLRTGQDAVDIYSERGGEYAYGSSTEFNADPFVGKGNGRKDKRTESPDVRKTLTVSVKGADFVANIHVGGCAEALRVNSSRKTEEIGPLPVAVYKSAGIDAVNLDTEELVVFVSAFVAESACVIEMEAPHIQEECITVSASFHPFPRAGERHPVLGFVFLTESVTADKLYYEESDDDETASTDT
jgi:hypothetical protein